MTDTLYMACSAQPRRPGTAKQAHSTPVWDPLTAVTQHVLCPECLCRDTFPQNKHFIANATAACCFSSTFIPKHCCQPALYSTTCSQRKTYGRFEIGTQLSSAPNLTRDPHTVPQTSLIKSHHQQARNTRARRTSPTGLQRYQLPSSPQTQQYPSETQPGIPPSTPMPSQGCIA